MPTIRLTLLILSLAALLPATVAARSKSPDRTLVIFPFEDFQNSPLLGLDLDSFRSICNATELELM